jgi:uncharacterized glyoxalase superfamily protein PhnB/ketosteroid isomerase-like protein
MVEAGDHAAYETALAVNDAINRRDLVALRGLLTADHTFIDSAANVLRGAENVLHAWTGFFEAFPDYRNVWTDLTLNGDLVVAIGHSICATEPQLDGPAIWTAAVRGDMVSTWRVYDDTPGNRARLGLGAQTLDSACVKSNRSIPSASVIPVLVYPDVREAVEWLEAAFGFVERVRIGENHRSQLSFGDGALIVGDVRHDRRPPRPGEETHAVVVRVADAHAHCERARAHGARIRMEPTDFEYGERQYEAEDPAGHRWIFSETLRDVAPEEWGGTTAG